MQLSRGASTDQRVWPAILASRGRGAASRPHAHHAMHLVLATRGNLTITVGDRVHEGAGVLTTPDVLHAIDASDRDVVLVFADPESDVGLRLRAAMKDPVRLVADVERRALLDRLPDPIDPRTLARWGEEALFVMAGEAPAPRRMHPRVRRVLAHMRASVGEDDASLAELAAIAGLSEGRLAHAFTESVGVPIRRYALWLKLQRAAGALLSGVSMTDAAQEGGFADAAHMSRTFRTMFGMRPSELRAAARS